MDFVEACRHLIAIESSPSHGSADIVRAAAELCRGKGLDVEIQEETQNGLSQANLIARPKGLGRPAAEFMLQSHLDTAEAGPFQLWAQNAQNPFDAAIIDGNIHGLGAADAKLDFLCKLEAISSFPGSQAWKMPPVLVGTYGQETGMAGALKLIRKNLVSARSALIGDPTNLTLVNAAKGYANVEIHLPFSAEEIRYRQEHDLRESTSTQSRLFHGRAGHASSPQLADSAILKMLDFLEQLPDGVVVMEVEGGQSPNSVPSHAFLEVEAAALKSSISGKIRHLYKVIRELEGEFEKYRDPDFNPPTPTLNIGLVKTHEDFVYIGGSCRIPPIISHAVYEAWMERLSKACLEVGGVFRVTDYKKPFRTEVKSVLVNGCLDEIRALGLPPNVTTQPSTNEASLFSRVGVECVCFGPGLRENNVHTPNEHVAVKDLQVATEFYRRAIERFCK